MEVRLDSEPQPQVSLLGRFEVGRRISFRIDDERVAVTKVNQVAAIPKSSIDDRHDVH